MIKQLRLPLADDPNHNRIVNIASVPQRSPFRYPGGKTWLAPYIRRWFASLTNQPTELIEPFAGGSSVGLTVAFENLAKHVILVEIDDAVAAVWQTLLQKEEGLWLAQQIGAFNLTLGNVEALLSSPTPTTHEKAFQTLVRNRVNRGGILAPGAGKIKYGENGKGITSRWYPKTLQKRILDIVAINDRLTFIYGDGFSVLAQNAHRIDVVFFIDPPYTVGGKKAGSRLYTHADMDHLELFRMAQTLTGDFLMTYDNTQEASDLARQHGFDTQAVAMKNTHHARLTELLIGRNLDWLR